MLNSQVAEYKSILHSEGRSAVAGSGQYRGQGSRAVPTQMAPWARRVVQPVETSGNVFAEYCCYATRCGWQPTGI